jgi:hypothetical protein
MFICDNFLFFKSLMLLLHASSLHCLAIRLHFITARTD